jgi:hypothetical protein
MPPAKPTNKPTSSFPVSPGTQVFGSSWRQEEKNPHKKAKSEPNLYHSTVRESHLLLARVLE